jgi:hypothetical protein
MKLGKLIQHLAQVTLQMHQGHNLPMIYRIAFYPKDAVAVFEVEVGHVLRPLLFNQLKQKPCPRSIGDIGLKDLYHGAVMPVVLS